MNTHKHEENKKLSAEEQKDLEEYKKESKEKMAKFFVGGKDTIGNTIERIFSKGDDFVVYDIAGVSSIESMKVFIRAEIKGDTKPEKNYQDIKEEFNKFKSVFYKTNADLSYKCRAANAISVALSGNKDKELAKHLLTTITKEALAEYKDIQQGRLWYLFGAVVFALLVTSMALVFYIYRSSDFVLNNQGLIIFIYSAAFSVFGGLFSISLKIKELFVEKALASYNYAFYGAQRLLFSILGGFAVIVLIKSKIILSGLMSGNDSLYALMAICYLAGFSETLIPNALKNIEEGAAKNNK